MKRNVKKELKELAERYTSLERVARALRPHPGFEKVSRATIYRWLQKPSRRTEVAVKILSSRSVPSKIRIAEPNSLFVLPSLMVNWQPDGKKPYGKLKEEFKLEAEKIMVNTGDEALEKLNAGKVEVALAAPELAAGLPDYCRRICSLTRAPMLGIANKPIGSFSELKGKRCGCFTGSATPERLRELSRDRKLNLGVYVYDAGPIDRIIKALNDKEIDCFVAWQPYIHQIKTACARLVTVKETIFSTIDIAVMVNLKEANPLSVRAYLQCLQEAAEYVEGHKKVDTFHQEVASHLLIDMRLSEQDIRRVLEDSTFSTADCDMSTLLMLWVRSEQRHDTSS